MDSIYKQKLKPLKKLTMHISNIKKKKARQNGITEKGI